MGKLPNCRISRIIEKQKTYKLTRRARCLKKVRRAAAKNKMRTLTKEQKKEIINEIFDEATSIIRDEAKGYEYVRIYVHLSKIDDFLNGENVEICAPHYFTNFQSDDIDQSDQFQIFSFQQMPELEDGWENSYNGENWIKRSEDEIYCNAKEFVNEYFK
jgi:hypothetical protein